MPWNQPARVAKVYLATPRITYWPTPDLDLPAEVAEVEARLAEVQRKHAQSVELVGGALIRQPEEVRPWLNRTGEIDGLLIVPLSEPVGPLDVLLEAVDLPCLYFARPYSTHSWAGIPAWQRKGKKIDVVNTSSYGGLDPYMRAFRTVHHLSHSKVIVCAPTRERPRQLGAEYGKAFGTAFKFYSGGEFKEALNAVDVRQAQKEADALTRGALQVIEPTTKQVLDALRFYMALGNILVQERANAITIDCFERRAAGGLPGYPCIAFSKFNDAGLYGVCDFDLHSTMTQMLVTSYARVPGFVSDPVVDVSRNEVTHAHCEAPTKMNGLDEPASPYILRNSQEFRDAPVLQVLMPSGGKVTVAKFSTPARMLISTAEVTDIPQHDRGCRTQIRTRVSDAAKWVRNYSTGLHRVVFYGDYVADIERMGRLMGFEVFHEM